MAQSGQESLKNNGFIKKEDIPVIMETLARGSVGEEDSKPLEKCTVFGKEWSLLLPIAIDLKIPVEEIKALKDDLESASVTESDCLSRILSIWVDNPGSEATWDKLISVFETNIAMYSRGNIRKDYVGLLKELSSSGKVVGAEAAPKENQAISGIKTRSEGPVPHVQNGMSFLDMFAPPEGEQFLEYTEEWQRAKETVDLNPVYDYMVDFE